MFKCNCGREFKTQKSLNSHARFCNLYIKKDKTSKYKIQDNLYKCECEKEFDNYQSLNAHFSHCDYHHNCLGTIRKPHTSEIRHSMCWENKTQEEINNIHKKSGKTVHNECLLGIRQGTFKGKHHSEETKEKTRISTIKYIKNLKGDFKARYNINACKYIDQLNIDKHWNLQHAENGGEYSVGGYFVDGYDKKLNIVFEYDEVAHYIDKENNILNDKDIRRQNNIIKKLNCEFWRYNEYLDLLYKVH